MWPVSLCFKCNMWRLTKKITVSVHIAMWIYHERAHELIHTTISILSSTKSKRNTNSQNRGRRESHGEANKTFGKQNCFYATSSCGLFSINIQTVTTHSSQQWQNKDGNHSTSGGVYGVCVCRRWWEEKNFCNKGHCNKTWHSYRTYCHLHAYDMIWLIQIILGLKLFLE